MNSYDKMSMRIKTKQTTRSSYIDHPVLALIYLYPSRERFQLLMYSLIYITAPSANCRLSNTVQVGIVLHDCGLLGFTEQICLCISIRVQQTTLIYFEQATLAINTAVPTVNCVLFACLLGTTIE